MAHGCRNAVSCLSARARNDATLAVNLSTTNTEAWITDAGIRVHGGVSVARLSTVTYPSSTRHRGRYLGT